MLNATISMSVSNIVDFRVDIERDRIYIEFEKHMKELQFNIHWDNEHSSFRRKNMMSIKLHRLKFLRLPLLKSLIGLPIDVYINIAYTS